MARVVSSESVPRPLVTPFCQIARSSLQQLSLGGLASRQYLRLSGMLQVCAYLYETGAVLGCAYRGELAEMVTTLCSPGEERYDLRDLKLALKTRLERTSRHSRSLYTFYLDCTMRKFNIDFSTQGMRQAHYELRTLGEAWPHFDYAGAEGLVIGSYFPDLVEKLYNKHHDEQSEIVREMKAYGVVAAGESEESDINQRERMVVDMFKGYF